MKEQILEMLRSSGEILSGTALSDKLGISRVSVWKHIHGLKEHGYDIIASSQGYRLAGSPDALFPWEFPERKSKIHYLSEVDSTMDIARELARGGCPHFSVVIAGSQKQGRGRLKRSWHSSEGGLYFTVVLRPPIPPVLSPRINFCSSLCLAQTLRRLFGIEAVVKWPNDILVGDRKLCGMLSEMEAEADRVAYINVGMGLNANNDPTGVEPGAVSLKEILDRPVQRKKILAEFLDTFETWMKTPDLDNVVKEWKEYTITLNRNVKIVTTRETFEGRAVDVDENGSLLLALADGSVKKILYGDCFHL